MDGYVRPERHLRPQTGIFQTVGVNHDVYGKRLKFLDKPYVNLKIVFIFLKR
jgi:hypothetical protein